MAFNTDLDPDDVIVVPPDSGAKIRFKEKSGRRTSVSIESAKPVQVIRAKAPTEDPGLIAKPVARAFAARRPE